MIYWLTVSVFRNDLKVEDKPVMESFDLAKKKSQQVTQTSIDLAVYTRTKSFIKEL